MKGLLTHVKAGWNRSSLRSSSGARHCIQRVNAHGRQQQRPARRWDQHIIFVCDPVDRIDQSNSWPSACSSRPNAVRNRALAQKRTGDCRVYESPSRTEDDKEIHLECASHAHPQTRKARRRRTRPHAFLLATVIARRGWIDRNGMPKSVLGMSSGLINDSADLFSVCPT